VKHRGALVVFASAENFGLSPRLAKNVWTTDQLNDPLALGLALLGLNTIPNLSAVQLSGLPGND
jgi:hypothetical protein